MVIATHRGGDHAVAEQRVVVRLDALHRVGDVVWVGGDIADVVDPQTVERRGPCGHVVGAQQHRLVADTSRAETCTRSVGGADVERHADHRGIELVG